jgi:hypothetical protein
VLRGARAKPPPTLAQSERGELKTAFQAKPLQVWVCQEISKNRSYF